MTGKKSGNRQGLRRLPLRLTPVAMVAISLLAAMPGFALADTPTVEELQAEIAKLKAQLAAKDEQLAKVQGAPGTPAATSPGGPAAGAIPVAAASAPESTAAAAQSAPKQLKKVVVRSKSKLERVQDVPQSISVVSGQTLNNELATDIGAISQRAANVVRGTGNSRTYAMLIRGVGKVTQTEAQDTSVGIALDGVNFAYAPMGSFDFYDVDTVEVAKGPQGTMGGHNYTVGTVSVTTRNPSFTPDASWSLAFGQHQTIISQVAGGGPVIDDLLAWRGALIVDKGDGPYINGYNTDQTYFNKDRVAGRVKFLLTPNADFSALATFELQPTGGEFYNSGVVTLPSPSHYTNTGKPTTDTAFDVAGKLGRAWFLDRNGGNNFYYNGLIDQTSFDVNDQKPLYTYTNGVSLQLKQSLGNYDLNSITATRQYHFAASNDDQTPFSIRTSGGGKVDLYKQVSQEFSVSNKPGSSLDWKTGLYFWYNRVDYGQTASNAGWGTDAGAYYATNAQYNTLYYGAASPAPGALPSASGQLLLTDSLAGLTKSSAQTITNKSASWFAHADWHLTDLLTLATGLRLQYDDRSNVTQSLIMSNGVGGALNPVKAGYVQLGGFDINSSGALKAGNSAAQIALANQVAQKYFGVSTYSALNATQLAQVAAAKAIRQSQLGTLWNTTNGPAFSKLLPGFSLSPSYQFTPNEIGYVALQYGEKGGVSQVVNGSPLLAKPEHAQNVEVGLKSAFLNRDLLINVDVFKSIIHNYQQVEVVPDPLAPSNTQQFTGNAAQVDIYGFELDGSYVATRDLTLRASGAYTIARYENFKDSPLPTDDHSVTIDGVKVVTQNVSGQLLPGAARLTFNIGADYHTPVWNNKVFHASFNTAFTSRYNSDPSLSTLAWVHAHSVTDASVGLGRQDQRFDASLIVKNLFNDKTPQGYAFSTTTAAAYSYVPALPRWWGIQFSGKF